MKVIEFSEKDLKEKSKEEIAGLIMKAIDINTEDGKMKPAKIIAETYPEIKEAKIDFEYEDSMDLLVLTANILHKALETAEMDFDSFARVYKDYYLEK